MELKIHSPEDDEIKQVADDQKQQDWNTLHEERAYRDGFVDGAKWLKDKATIRFT